MGRLVVLMALVLGACTTTEEATANRLAAWRGRPVSDFVARLSWPPEHVMAEGPGRRAYVFRKYGVGGGCGATLWAKAAPDGTYVIDRASSTCGPAAF